MEVGTVCSVEGRGCEQMGEVGVLTRRPRGGSGADFTGEVGITGSWVATGWERTGERGVLGFCSEGYSTLLPVRGKKGSGKKRTPGEVRSCRGDLVEAWDKKMS